MKRKGNLDFLLSELHQKTLWAENFNHHSLIEEEMKCFSMLFDLPKPCVSKIYQLIGNLNAKRALSIAKLQKSKSSSKPKEQSFDINFHPNPLIEEEV